MKEDDDSDWILMYSVAIGFTCSSILFVIFGSSLSYMTAVMAGKDPLTSVLLTKSSQDLISFASLRSPFDAGLQILSTVFAIIAFYGILALSIPLIFLVIKHKGVSKLLTLTQGIIFGLSITMVWFEWSKTGRITIFAPRVFDIGYVYFIFLLSEGVKAIIEHKGILAIPYIYAVDGVFGTFIVLIVSQGYDPSFADVLLGPFFLIGVAVSIFVVEWVMMRPATILFGGMGLTFSDRRLDRLIGSRHVATRELLKFVALLFFRKVRQMANIPYARRAKLMESAGAWAIRRMPKAPRFSLRRLHWGLVATVCAINLLFPLAILLVVWLAF